VLFLLVVVKWEADAPDKPSKTTTMAPGAVPTTQGDDDDDDGESANFYDTELTGDANEPVISDPEWKTVERPDHVALFVITPLND